MIQAPYRQPVLKADGIIERQWQRWLYDAIREFNDSANPPVPQAETPTQTGDLEYRLSFQPIAGTLKYYQNGILQSDDDDGSYSLNGRVITLRIPLVGAWHFATYDMSSDIRSKFVDEVPDGVLDDVNCEFTLSGTPVAGSLFYYVNGVLQREGASYDYVLDGLTIVTIVPPVNRHFATWQSVDGVPRYINEVPDGVIDGSNLVFSLTEIPAPGSLRYFSGQLLRRDTQDYSVSGTELTTALPLIDGDWHIAAYEVA